MRLSLTTALVALVASGASALPHGAPLAERATPAATTTINFVQRTVTSTYTPTASTTLATTAKSTTRTTETSYSTRVTGAALTPSTTITKTARTTTTTEIDLTSYKTTRTKTFITGNVFTTSTTTLTSGTSTNFIYTVSAVPQQKRGRVLVRDSTPFCDAELYGCYLACDNAGTSIQDNTCQLKAGTTSTYQLSCIGADGSNQNAAAIAQAKSMYPATITNVVTATRSRTTTIRPTTTTTSTVVRSLTTVIGLGSTVTTSTSTSTRQTTVRTTISTFTSPVSTYRLNVESTTTTVPAAVETFSGSIASLGTVQMMSDYSTVYNLGMNAQGYPALVVGGSSVTLQARQDAATGLFALQDVSSGQFLLGEVLFTSPDPIDDASSGGWQLFFGDSTQETASPASATDNLGPIGGRPTEKFIFKAQSAQIPDGSGGLKTETVLIPAYVNTGNSIWYGGAFYDITGDNFPMAFYTGNEGLFAATHDTNLRGFTQNDEIPTPLNFVWNCAGC